MDLDQVACQSCSAVATKLEKISQQNRTPKYVGLLALALSIASTIWVLSEVRWSSVHAAPQTDGVLHVRGLIVEDEHGVERVRLGAPLPDPMGSDGVRHKRTGAISGMLISDAKGTERGGYVTADPSDEAFLTLDSRRGQEVLFLANPDGGTNLDLFDRGGNEAQLTVLPGGPKFVLKKQAKVVAQLPKFAEQTK